MQGAVFFLEGSARILSSEILGNCFFYDRYIFLRCNYIYIFFWHQFAVTFEGLLYQRFSNTKNIQELFGVVAAAHRPKPAADAAGHYCYVVMFVHSKMGELG